MPYGCFEQTSSTTYPNVLALDYLRRTGRSVPEVEAKARQYIHLGYQRLLGFEVPGGGFEWFGQPPAHLVLTAYGLMEFQDMSRVYDVDPNLIDRTRAWLLGQRAPDGSWSEGNRLLHEPPGSGVSAASSPNLVTTAYVALAVFGGGRIAEAEPTLRWLLAQPLEMLENPYALAIAIRAIQAMSDGHPAIQPLLVRLESLKRTGRDGKTAWWEQPATARTPFHSWGQAGQIETTAMVALALIENRQFPATLRGALQWLVEHKDPSGTWYSTQATVLALHALLLGTGQSLADDAERRIEISVDGQLVRTVTIPADQSDVLAQIDLLQMTMSGKRRLTLRELSNTAIGYQVSLEYYVKSQNDSPQPSEPLSVRIVYDRQRLNVDESVTAVATVVNNSPRLAPMVILDLPIPGGFAMESKEFEELKDAGTIAKYQMAPSRATVYLRGLESGQTLQLRYRLKAILPVKVSVPPAEVYEYYNPAQRGVSEVMNLESVET